MLSREIMGVLALAILWVNTLLIAGAALQRVAALRERRRRLDDGLVRATVARGDGPGGAIAVHRVEQVGRAASAEGTILFADRATADEALGGALSLAGGGEATLAAGTEVELWLDGGEVAEAGACASDAAFAEAMDQAKKARGFARTVSAGVAEGREIFVHARLVRERGEATLAPAGEGGVLIATFDPRAWLSRKIALALAFVAGDVVAAAACTAIALQRPHFGLVSTVGGALCLAFFLLIQPAGTALRDAVLLPSRAILRGQWTRKGAEARGSAPVARSAAR